MHSQPQLEMRSGNKERVLFMAGVGLFLVLFWTGGAFRTDLFLCSGSREPSKQRLQGVQGVPSPHGLHGIHGVRGLQKLQGILSKLLLWDHRALARYALRPYLMHPYLFLLICAGLAFGPLLYGASRNDWIHRRSDMVWAALTGLVLAFSTALPYWLVPPSLPLFDRTWWRATPLVAGTALFLIVGLLRAAGPGMRTRDILRRPHAYDLMDLSGAARLPELKRAGLLVRSFSWPDPTGGKLRERLCIGRLYDDGRPAGYFVAPHITKLQQTVVVAPTGSGKTTSLALPWSRELPARGQSVFVLDFKGDMAHAIASRTSSTEGFPMWVFNPLIPSSVKWNPMREPVPGSAEFQESQDAIAEALFGEVNHGAYQYFDLLDLRILKAGVRALGHLEDRTLKGLHDLFLSQEHLETTLDRIKDEADADTLARIEADLKASTDSRKYTFTERIQGVRNKLDAFAHPGIQRVTGSDAEFRLSRLLEQPSCLVFAAPMRLGLAGETLAAMAVRLIQHQLHRRYGHRGGKLFLILDEFSKLAMDHRQTERFISVSRSAGAVSVIILQDVDQLHAATRSSIWGNCQDRYILRGASASTSKWLSQSLGERRIWSRSVSSSSTKGRKHASEGGSLSAREDFVPVLRPREITLTGGLERGAWLQLGRYSTKPILVDLTRPL